ncbi:ATP-binding response regulator [Steroidobacter cummioxidans]|uniref:ATP-binding response regulator n=1 Tax=Steroidobacter cummioxidans TaxID=1803913 RepID=UPI000E3244CA|nr:hybrid sensor histidine kinase/response regulator [Steroidobacter cummioxidans]
MSATADIDRIRAEQIRTIYRNTPPGLLMTLVAVAVMTGAFVYIEPSLRDGAIVFILVMIAQTVARLLLQRTFARVPRPDTDWRRWARWFSAGTFVGGTTIGVGTILLLPTGNTQLELIALPVIFAVTSGAVGAFSAFPPAFFVFFAAVSWAPILWLFSRGDALHVTMGVLYVMWFFTVAELARRSGRGFLETLQLRFENFDLVSDLRREKAAAEEANAAKSRFLAAASHDLRQPVHALSLFVAAAQIQPINSETRSLLDHIDDSVRSLGRLFGGLLDISRLDAGVVEVNRLSFAVRPVIHNVFREFAAQAEEKGLQLRMRVPDVAVHSDPLLFERIVRNVVANAVAYTTNGGVLIGCRQRTGALRIEVWDTGWGIAPAHREQVFEEFYQVGNPERDRTKGVGLGLAIVKRLTTLLGHRIELRSKPCRGSCFALEVPLAATSAAHPVTIPAESLAPVQLGSGLILVLDDELTIQIGMKTLLESWGYRVLAAGSGDEMLEAIATADEAPRLIICDYRLRDNETGTAVVERLRSEFNDDIPAMLITGDTAPDRIREAEASGLLLLHKPVPNGKLRAAIAHLTSLAPA